MRKFTEMEIKLSEELRRKINTGNIKAKEVISFILANVPGTSTTKPINETSMLDISFNGKRAVYAETDRYTGIMYITLQ